MFHTQLGCVYVIYVCIPVTLKTGTEILVSWMNITQVFPVWFMGGYPWGSPLKFEENIKRGLKIYGWLPKIFLFCHCHTSEDIPSWKKGIPPVMATLTGNMMINHWIWKVFPLIFIPKFSTCLLVLAPLWPSPSRLVLGPDHRVWLHRAQDLIVQKWMFTWCIYIHYIALASTFTISYIVIFYVNIGTYFYKLLNLCPEAHYSTSTSWPFKASRHLRRWPLGTQLSWKRRPDTCNTT